MPNYPVGPIMPSPQSVPLSHKPYNLQKDALTAQTACCPFRRVQFASKESKSTNNKIKKKRQGKSSLQVMSLWFNININWGTLQYISHCTPTPNLGTLQYISHCTHHPNPITNDPTLSTAPILHFLAMYSKPQFSGPSTNNYRGHCLSELHC